MLSPLAGEHLKVIEAVWVCCIALVTVFCSNIAYTPDLESGSRMSDAIGCIPRNQLMTLKLNACEQQCDASAFFFSTLAFVALQWMIILTDVR